MYGTRRFGRCPVNTCVVFSFNKNVQTYWMIVFSLNISTKISTVHPGPIDQLVKVWKRG